MAFALVIARGKGRGRRYRFDGGITLGRDATNDVVVNRAAVSRTHARIEPQGEGWAVLDRGSANGTELNGAPLAGRAQLREGDRIGLGGVLFEFRGARRAGPPQARWRGLPAPTRATILAGAVLLAGIAVERAVHLAHADLRGADAVGAARGEVAPTTGSAPSRPSPGEARAAYQRGLRKLQERRIAPGNLYQAWKAFLEVRTRQQGLERPPDFSGELERLIGDAERELIRECRRLLFTASRFERYGEEEKAQRIWREILLHFPGDDPAGCRGKAQDNLVSPQPDDAAG
ncbi:MAG: FHA domain-containing protein [Myxococcales bacterium]